MTVYTIFRNRGRTPKSFDPNDERAKSKTQQHFKDECDINAIIRRSIRTGEPPPFKMAGSYGDFSAFTDYRDALHLINDAQEAFDSLPSKVRAHFDNEPAKLLAFMNDAKNTDQAVELGLLKRVVPEGTVTVETLKTEPKK